MSYVVVCFLGIRKQNNTQTEQKNDNNNRTFTQKRKRSHTIVRNMLQVLSIYTWHLNKDRSIYFGLLFNDPMQSHLFCFIFFSLCASNLPSNVILRRTFPFFSLFLPRHSPISSSPFAGVFVFVSLIMLISFVFAFGSVFVCLFNIHWNCCCCCVYIIFTLTLTFSTLIQTVTQLDKCLSNIHDIFYLHRHSMSYNADLANFAVQHSTCQ